MELRSLGRTGPRVSTLGLGLFKLGRNQGTRYPRAYELPSDQDAAALLARAAELGVNLLDTAPAYGVSETRLGELMRRNHWFGSRDQWVVCTKAGEEFDNGESRFDFSAVSLRASVERSLKRIGVDVLDVVLLHSDGRDVDVLESGALDTLLDLKQRGLIRAVGFSGKTIAGGIAACARGAEVLMVTYNSRDASQAPLIRFAGKEQVGVLIKKPFASGWLAGEATEQNKLRFILENLSSDFSSIVVGTASVEHLSHNALALAH